MVRCTACYYDLNVSHAGGALTRSRMQPVWSGKEFIPRLMQPVDVSYDHRVIDGAEAARFVASLGKYLTDIRRVLL